MSDALFEQNDESEADAPEADVWNPGRRMSGEHAFPAISIDEIAARACREPLDRERLELARKVCRNSKSRLLVDGVDPRRPEQAGWGVVFPAEGKSEIRQALKPLIEWRRAQVAASDGSRFRELYGDRGYRNGESLSDFLDRHRASYDVVDPRRFPYYWLLAGSPEEIPFAFQSQLDLQHGVARLDFSTPDEYGDYAEKVIRAEQKSRLPRQRRAVYFCPTVDRVTTRIVRQLVKPLVRKFQTDPVSGWTLDLILGEEATRQRLIDILDGSDPADLLFTASHGVFCEPTDPNQREQQGGLWCQDGPVIAADLHNINCEPNLVGFHFACFGAGTERWDEFERESDGTPIVRAARPFTASLPQNLLKQGALAILGHIGRSWTSSFNRTGDSGGDSEPPLLEVFSMTLRRLLQGNPVGHALEPFNVRYAADTAKLADLNLARRFGAHNEIRHAEVFRSFLDARNFVVLGDPVAKIPGS